MSNTLLKICFAVLLVVCFNFSSCSLANNFENALDLNSAKPDQDKAYGPRISRKKRSEKYDPKKISQLLESLEDYPWTLITISDNNDVEKRGQTHNFIPRLGRNLEETHLADDEGVQERSPPFSPRLGRRFKNQYSPRLGRDDGIAYL